MREFSIENSSLLVGNVGAKASNFSVRGNIPGIATQAPSMLNMLEKDLFWENEFLCINAAGDHGSTAIVDAKGHTVTRTGSVSVSTVLGFPTLYFDGSSHLTIPLNSTEANAGTGSYGVEIYFYGPSHSGIKTLFSTGTSSWNPPAIVFTSSDTRISIANYDIQSVSGTYSGNVLHHALFIRHANNQRIWLDGVYQTQLGNTRSFDFAGNLGCVYVGVAAHNGGEKWVGHIASIRAGVGFARITDTSNFIPSPYPFPER